jgi:hypothetical protein
MNKKPIYMIPESDIRIVQWKEAFEMFADKNKKAISFNVEPDVVDSGGVYTPIEMVSILQHYPRLIPKFIFAIDFKFQKIKDIDIFFPPALWKMDRKYQLWFFGLANDPLIIFFLSDFDSRFFCIAGDLLAAGKVNNTYRQRKTKAVVVGKYLDLISHRFLTSACQFYIFCYNTGFDPEPPITLLITEFNLAITFDNVKQQAEKEIKKESAAALLLKKRD